MLKTLPRILSLGLLISSVALPLHADTTYLFVSDRAPDPARTSSIHRYAIDSANPGAITPAPSAGQSGTLWEKAPGRNTRECASPIWWWLPTAICMQRAATPIA